MEAGMPAGVDAVVVGAGLSGLICAERLRQQGLTVRLLEASERWGGRLMGHTTPAGLALDLGGQWVGANHHTLLGLLERFALRRYPTFYGGEGIFRWQGRNHRGPVESAFRSSLLFFQPGELGLPAEAVAQALHLQKQFLSLAAGVPAQQPWLADDAETLDRLSVAGWLERQGAADLAAYPLAWLARLGGSGGFEPHESSLLHLAWTQAASPQREVPEAWLLRGGAGQVAERLAADLGAALHCGCPAVAIHQDSDGAAVMTADGDRHRCQAVVVALPPSQRQRLQFDPPLPADQAALQQRWPMGAMVKVLAVYPRAFWRDDGRNGLALGERAWLELTADTSPPEAEPGVLAGFIAADRALAFGTMTPATQRACLLAELESLWGPEAGQPIDLIWHDWGAEPWTGGAFTAFPVPGTWTTFGDAWRRPHGRVVWAGTEMARRWPGYFEGAIRAGEAAAAAVIERQERSMRR